MFFVPTHWTYMHLYICINNYCQNLVSLKLYIEDHTTRKHGFLQGQLDWNVHIDQKVCPFWLKVWGMTNTCYIWPIHLITMTFLTECQVEYLVKMDKPTSKWSWLNQIGHIEWIRVNQIYDYDLTLSQMNHTHLMTWPSC